MGISSIINLFLGCDAYMRGKLKEAVKSSQWKQGENPVGMKVNTDMARKYLSKHSDDILGSRDSAEDITFIMRLGNTHYRCELLSEPLNEVISVLFVHR